MSLYADSYDKLTEKQRQAVDYTEGPLLVIAGPGTGKTQLLSTRVARILETTDTNPENILCLTFTNKAAANMRQRLQKFIGPESLHVNVKTFHSLSAEIMGEYPDYFWSGAKLATAPDAVQTDIIESILTELPLDNPLASKFAGNYTSISRVKEALKLAKEAGLTPDKLRAILDYNLIYIDTIEDRLVDIIPPRLSYKALEQLQTDIDTLPTQAVDDLIKPLLSLSTIIKDSLAYAVKQDQGTNKTKHTGAWRNTFIQSEAGKRGFHKQRRANEWWRNLADVYGVYRDKLHQRGYYDYSDMLIEVIAQLESNPSILSDIQERYQYIMIDEFQDTNAAQMRLAHLIASHPLDEDRPNLMAVGDDDQSIFKFNGAELNNMLNFQRTYPSAKTIVLEDNFRSTQAVLDTSKKIIELAEDRLVNRNESISKNLIARNKIGASSEIIHYSYPSKEFQLYNIVQQIKQRHNNDSEQGTIAVIARKHSSLEAIAGQLHKIGLPVSYERQNNILEHNSVKQIITICRIIQGINDGDESTVNQQLASLIGHPMWSIDSRKLWQIAVSNRYSPNWIGQLLGEEDTYLNSIGEWLLWLAEQSRQFNLGIVIDYILGLRQTDQFTSPFRIYYLENRPVQTEYIETLTSVQKLRHMVNEFTHGREASVQDFIKFINLHDTNSITIANESVFTTAGNAIHLLTAHKAKGLEFDTVFIIDAIDKEWRPSNRSTNTPINLPLQPYGEDMDDYIRLMYVATTRAKQNIIASSYRFDTSNAEVVATPLITSAIDTNEIDSGEMPEFVDILETSLSWPTLSSDDARQILRPILEEFTLNVTALMNFLDLTKGGPSYFLERNLLRLPGQRTASLAFGTAIHSALETAQRQINKGKFDLDSTIDYFRSEIDKEPILPSELSRWKSVGQDLIKKLFEEQLIILPEGGIPEQKLTGIDINGAIIDGKLDHIIVDKDTKSLLITDYKTGTPLTSFLSKDKSKQVQLWKHRTQLVFYALLAQNHPIYKGLDITCRMQYLEANAAKDVSREYAPTSQEIERLANICRAVYKKITSYDLPDTSRYSPDIDGIMNFEEDLLSNNI